METSGRVRGTLAGLALGVVASAAAPAPAQQQIATWPGFQDGSLFGRATAFAGDVDGDGRDDLVVGAPAFNTTFEAAGAAYVLSGADGAVLHVFLGGQKDDVLGISVDGGGDVDGDGTPDVVVGAPRLLQGSATVYSGATGTPLLSEGASTSACFYFNSFFGRSVAMLGDYDGDGRDDAAFGWTIDALGGCYYPGGVSVHGYDPALGSGFLVDRLSDCSCNCMLEAGESVAAIGDVNGDGFADLVRAVGSDVFSSPGENTIRLNLGPDGSEWWSVPIDGPGSNLLPFYGKWLCGLGDASGDGVPDLAMLARFATTSPDWGVRILSGADGSLIHDLGIVGSELGAPGDVDGDGRADLVVGDPTDAFLGPNSGVARVFSGRTGSVLATMYGAGPGHGFGVSVAGGGDANGDGVPDVLVGAAGGPGAPAGYVAVFTGAIEAPGSYCTAKPNSLGCAPRIGWTGTPEASGPDDFVVTCEDVLPARAGMPFWGASGPTAVPFAGGTLCVQPPLVRGPLDWSAGTTGCTGDHRFAFTQPYMLTYGLVPETRVFAQWWMRDPAQADGTGVALSDALELQILP